MARKTKFQKILSELIDGCIEEYTNKNISLEVKDEIKDMDSIEDIKFKQDNKVITLSDIIENVSYDIADKKSTELIYLLKEHGINYDLEYLSGDFQFHITLENQDIVINEGTEKEFVIFIGDIAIDLTQEELKKFLEGNNKVTHLKGMLEPIESKTEELNKLDNHFSDIGYDFSGDAKLLEEVKKEVESIGFYTSGESKISFDISFGLESDITIFVLNNSKYISTYGHKTVEELKYSSLQELENKINSKYREYYKKEFEKFLENNPEENKAWHVGLGENGDGDIGIEVCSDPLREIKKDLEYTGYKYSIKGDKIKIPFASDIDVVITVEDKVKYISINGDSYKEELEYNSLEELKYKISEKYYQAY